MKKYSLIIFILFIVYCKSGNDTKLVTVKNKYSVELPAFLIKAEVILDKDELNEDASLQYLNGLRELYVVVIEDTKSEFQQVLIKNKLNEKFPNNLKSYSNYILRYMKDQTQILHKSAMIDTIVNKLPAKIVSVSGKVEDINVFYMIGFIEGNNTYYQIITWTISGFENKYKERMKKIIFSFKEL